MKALILKEINKIELSNVPVPVKAAPDHLIIKIQACAINSGDKLFISGAFPRGIPLSKYNIAGVSGVGKVIEAGQSVPDYYKGKNVTIYRSLKYTEETTGTWSEYAHLHYLNCAVLPEEINPEVCSGSLVNIITPYSFLKQASEAGLSGMICTAGNSATGAAMLGLCQLYKFPLISIVRTEKGKTELQALGARHVVVQNDRDFKQQLKQLGEQLNIQLVFDGVGGATLSRIIDILPFNTTVYSYGFLDKENAFSFHTTTLMRGITIKGFSNFRTSTVQDPAKLEQALRDITSIIGQSHYHTKLAKRFDFEQAGDAIEFSSPGSGKAVLIA